MGKFYSEFWEDILLGRAYLPVYAILAQQNDDTPLIPPIAFWKYSDDQI